MSPLNHVPESDPLIRQARKRALEDELTGPRYWRSLEELAETPEFQEYLYREFPENASEWSDPVGRRTFLKLMGASLALAGVAGCVRQPPEKIVPFVRQPEELIPGRPLYFATAVEQQGVAHPVLVESHMGRPTKIEGNPEHPASNGATNLFSQASILELYDPDRSQVILEGGRISTWDNFLQQLGTRIAAQQTRGGAGLRILTPTISSPSLGSLLQRLRTAFPNLTWHQWEPCGFHNQRLGSRLAFGRSLDCRYHFRRAEVILSLDDDFLFWERGAVRYARDFADRRRDSQNRLYQIESTPSVTGSMADHRLALTSRGVSAAAAAIAARLGVGDAPRNVSGVPENWLAAVVDDLRSQPGASLVLAGENQPGWVHALAHRLNQELGNVGSTVQYIPSIEVEPVDQLESMRQLVAAMQAGTVDMLLILGGNPAYDAPADLDFADHLGRVPFRVHLSLHEDETSRLCHWHIPQSHPLESWFDSRAYDGSVTIGQPLIEPLYNGKSNLELVAALLGDTGSSTRDLVLEHWTANHAGDDFETFWNQSVHDGRVAGSEFAPVAVSSDFSDWESPAAEGELEVQFRSDPATLDGRYSNNGWLQELPRPITKLTWDNALLLAPATAEKYGLASGDMAEVAVGEGRVSGPIWVLPGQAPDTVTLPLGYGRTRSGRVGSQVGFDAYPLRRSSDLNIAAGTLRKTGSRYPLASTQGHFLISVEESRAAEKRHLIRETTLARYREEPDVIHEMSHEFPEDYTLYPPHEYKGHAWGMAIDLNACSGCNACVVACQAENNIPVVGKDQVLKGREMHWIRIDRYFTGSVDAPRYRNQPVMCQHCENAPCEVVCPVAATTHSPEGLNEMTYNRCVGTRYCSNNCPYKVRRFNFLLYQDWETASLKPMRNPDVSIRSRGVMEKCSYCVQRINSARIDAKNAGRPIRDGEIATACEAACPSGAIVFGDVNDEGSRVARLKSEKRNYGILTELNTRPRTTYLARLTNPNPEIADEQA